MRLGRLALLPLAATLLLALAARADTLRTFNVETTLFGQADATLTGTETIDTTLGLLTAVDLTLTDAGQRYTLSLADFSGGPPKPDSVPCSAETVAVGACVFAQSFSNQREDLSAKLDFDLSATGSLVNFAGAPFCGSDGANCRAGCCDDNDTLQVGADLYYVTGNLVLASTGTTATPEPVSLLFLGTGALGLFAAHRRSHPRNSHP